METREIEKKYQLSTITPKEYVCPNCGENHVRTIEEAIILMRNDIRADICDNCYANGVLNEQNAGHV